MKRSVLTALGVLIFVDVFTGHDLFLKLDSFFLKEKTAVSIALLNGTFEKSENVITRDRMLDVSIVGPENQRIHPDTSQWRNAGAKTMLDFTTGEPGTYVVGVSTAPRMIELSATDFNEYLKHDGVLDVLAKRKKNDELDKNAREKYSKHVKAVIQVGNKKSKGYGIKLAYPVELVPLQNPYDLSKGDELDLLFLKGGQPVANQLIYASHEGFHAHSDEGEHREAVQTRTDKTGIAKIKLSESGRWYVRVIHMEESSEPNVDYESNWATLTFEVKLK